MAPLSTIISTDDGSIHFIAVRDAEGNISRVRLDAKCHFSILPLENDCTGMNYLLQVERDGQTFKAGRYKDLATIEQACERLKNHRCSASAV